MSILLIHRGLPCLKNVRSFSQELLDPFRANSVIIKKSELKLRGIACRSIQLVVLRFHRVSLCIQIPMQPITEFSP